MDSNTELYDRYILGQMDAAEEAEFKQKLKTDRKLASDFRLYLLAIEGMRREAEQDDVELGHALKNISRRELMGIIGRRVRFPRLRRQLGWVASVAILVVAGTVLLESGRASSNRIDDLLVAYNYTPTISKGADTENANRYASKDIMDLPDQELRYLLPKLRKEYKTTPEGDMELGEQRGMTLAMVYLRLHERRQAEEVLLEMISRYSDDREFVEQCLRILIELK